MLLSSREARILIRKDIDEAVKGCWQLCNRVMILNIDAKPVALNIIQAYAPTNNHTDEAIEEF